jgi:hypothetical protein
MGGGGTSDQRSGGGGGRYLNRGDIQQLTRESRERRGDAQNLRDRLAEQGYDVSDLDRILREMRTLDDARIYSDAEEVQRLQAAVVEGLKSVEYRLRRQIEGASTEKLFLGGSGDVPASYRQQVEEYYKRLSTKGASAPPPATRPPAANPPR